MLKLCHMTQDVSCFFSCFAFSTFFILSILANLRSAWTEPLIVICLPFVRILCLCLFFRHFSACLALWAAPLAFQKSSHTLPHCVFGSLQKPLRLLGPPLYPLCLYPLDLQSTLRFWKPTFTNSDIRHRTYDFIPRLPLLWLLWLLGWYSHHFPRFPSLV